MGKELLSGSFDATIFILPNNGEASNVRVHISSTRDEARQGIRTLLTLELRIRMHNPYAAPAPIEYTIFSKELCMRHFFTASIGVYTTYTILVRSRLFNSLFVSNHIMTICFTA